MRFSVLAAVAAVASVAFSSCVSKDLRDFAGKADRWSIVVEGLDGKDKDMTLSTYKYGMNPVISTKGRRLVYEYRNYADMAIDVSITYSKKKGAFIAEPRIENREEGLFVKTFYGPQFQSPELNTDTKDLLLPIGAGERISGLPSKGGKWWKWVPGGSYYEVVASGYPGYGCSMQWFAFAGQDEGWYISSLDRSFSGKRLMVRYHEKSGETSGAVQYMLTCLPGESVSVPATAFVHYRGDWHSAADIYRKWFDAEGPELMDTPEWVRDCSGWMLTILRQQNNRMMWTYPEISEEMARVADENGVDMLGLFGWTVGGHDRQYPIYEPSDQMGGREALRKAIADAHGKGKRVILYMNGQLMQTDSSEFWENEGRKLAVVRRDGSNSLAHFTKFKTTPEYTQATACLEAPGWRRIIMDFALNACELGADGVLYDQLGVSSPRYCYSPEHGHKVPSLSHDYDKVEMMKWVSDSLRTINPDFILMTEGIADCERNCISMFHGYGNAISRLTDEALDQMLDPDASAAPFPEMFKYTFPEYCSTFRNSTPTAERRMVNFATTFGFRPEIECRFMGDKRLLVDGIMPSAEDYSDVVKGMPVIDPDPEAARIYLKQGIDFQRANRDLLWNGRFLDTKGFTLSSESGSVIAKAFANGRDLGVVIWNASEESAAAYSLDVPGYRFESISSPDAEAVLGTVAPSSVQLVRFSR